LKQYFCENPEILTHEREISANIFGKNLRFLTNNGLFSCNEIDDASRLLVETIPPISGSFLDLGCGYGFIGIACACAKRTVIAGDMLPMPHVPSKPETSSGANPDAGSMLSMPHVPARGADERPPVSETIFSLTMSDINRVALDYAEKNVRLNNVPAKIIHSDSFEKIDETFDCITLNPPIHAGKETMYRMYEDAAAHLNPGGSFFVVIRKKHGAESTLKKFFEIFSRVEVLCKKKGCLVIRGGN